MWSWLFSWLWTRSPQEPPTSQPLQVSREVRGFRSSGSPPVWFIICDKVWITLLNICTKQDFVCFSSQEFKKEPQEESEKRVTSFLLYIFFFLHLSLVWNVTSVFMVVSLWVCVKLFSFILKNHRETEAVNEIICKCRKWLCFKPFLLIELIKILIDWSWVCGGFDSRVRPEGFSFRLMNVHLEVKGLRWN